MVICPWDYDDAGGSIAVSLKDRLPRGVGSVRRRSGHLERPYSPVPSRDTSGDPEATQRPGRVRHAILSRLVRHYVRTRRTPGTERTLFPCRRRCRAQGQTLSPFRTLRREGLFRSQGPRAEAVRGRETSRRRSEPPADRPYCIPCSSWTCLCRKPALGPPNEVLVTNDRNPIDVLLICSRRTSDPATCFRLGKAGPPGVNDPVACLSATLLALVDDVSNRVRTGAWFKRLKLVLQPIDERVALPSGTRDALEWIGLDFATELTEILRYCLLLRCESDTERRCLRCTRACDRARFRELSGPLPEPRGDAAEQSAAADVLECLAARWVSALVSRRRTEFDRPGSSTGEGAGCRGREPSTQGDLGRDAARCACRADNRDDGSHVLCSFQLSVVSQGLLEGPSEERVLTGMEHECREAEGIARDGRFGGCGRRGCRRRA